MSERAHGHAVHRTGDGFATRCAACGAAIARCFGEDWACEFCGWTMGRFEDAVVAADRGALSRLLLEGKRV